MSLARYRHIGHEFRFVQQKPQREGSLLRSHQVSRSPLVLYLQIPGIFQWTLVACECQYNKL